MWVRKFVQATWLQFVEQQVEQLELIAENNSRQSEIQNVAQHSKEKLVSKLTSRTTGVMTHRQKRDIAELSFENNCHMVVTMSGN